MKDIQTIQKELRSHAKVTGEKTARFFKTSPGEYAAHDLFLGVAVPDIRLVAKNYQDIPIKLLKDLLSSAYNEERLLALIILVNQYQNGGDKNKIYDFYLKNKAFVNNWNLVDASAHLIVGAHLFEKDKAILLALVESDNLWDRRIAIVATWYFIRQNHLTWTFKLARKLLSDEEDLIHKAAGWMLREAGKRDEDQLKSFLDKHASHMPRTMLRYAIEKLTLFERKQYMGL